MKTPTNRLLAVIAVLLALNLLRPASTVPVLDLSTRAPAQPAHTGLTLPNYIITSNPEGTNLYIWHDDGRGWKAEKKSF